MKKNDTDTSDFDPTLPTIREFGEDGDFDLWDDEDYVTTFQVLGDTFHA